MPLKFRKWNYVLLSLVWIPGLTLSATPVGKQAGAALYQDECASCHTAYPAELLPTRSWQKILAGLDQHFGDNISLGNTSLTTLARYLQAHSAERAGTHRARRILQSIPQDQTPLRISTLPYIQRRHHELPARLVTGNPQVKSLSNCIACHRGAERGVFNEDTVRIPGYGRWDD
ncbi:MAG: diheme cytochrome c [Gammaproteobacteria bacterium]